MAMTSYQFDSIFGRNSVFGRFMSTSAIYIIAASLGLLAGLISAIGEPLYVAIFAGLVVGGMLAASKRALMWFVIVSGVVITGAAQLYVPGARYIRYVVPVAAVVLLIHAAVERIRQTNQARQQQISWLGIWAIAFAAVAVFSSLVNWSGVGVAVTGLRGYFQMWPFLVALLLIRWTPADVRSVPKGMFLIALLQIPFALHQYFYLVPRRVGMGHGIVPVDIVAGTFGGDFLGGGANAVLAAFMMIAIACLAGLVKHKAMSIVTASFFAIIFISPVMVNEAKISAIYLPLIFIVIFYKDILVRPIRFLAATIIMMGVLAGLLTALTLSQASGRLQTWSDLITFTIERQTADAAERRGQFSELSRLTALTFWFEENKSANPANILLGHGPGASRVQDSGIDIAKTLAEKHYGGVKIGHTAVAALLWDVGIVGLGAVLGMFFAAFRAARWLAQHYRESDRFKAGLFDGLAAGVAVLTLSLAHKDFLVVHLPFQTLVLLIFGYIMISVRHARGPSEIA